MTKIERDELRRLCDKPGIGLKRAAEIEALHWLPKLLDALDEAESEIERLRKLNEWDSLP